MARAVFGGGLLRPTTCCTPAEPGSAARLMIAMVASFGFLRMALATSAGAEVQRPLAAS